MLPERFLRFPADREADGSAREQHLIMPLDGLLAFPAGGGEAAWPVWQELEAERERRTEHGPQEGGW